MIDGGQFIFRRTAVVGCPMRTGNGSGAVAMMAKLLVTGVLITGMMTGCSKRDAAVREKIQDMRNNTKVSGIVLPFKLCTIAHEQQMDRGLSGIAITVRIKGGTADDWGATGIAIAKRLGSLANDIKVVVDRSDLGDIESQTDDRFKHLAQVIYSPTPSHSIYGGTGSQWLISMPKNDKIASINEIQLSNDYYAELAKNSGNQKKAEQYVEKKYQLGKDWELPLGNLVDTTYVADDFDIDEGDEKDKLSDLQSEVVNNNKDVKQFNCQF